MILNPSQARAVYDAMCALNNVGGVVDVIFNDASGIVQVTDRVTLGVLVLGRGSEIYMSQTEFAAAYDLI